MPSPKIIHKRSLKFTSKGPWSWLLFKPERTSGGGNRAIRTPKTRTTTAVIDKQPMVYTLFSFCGAGQTDPSPSRPSLKSRISNSQISLLKFFSFSFFAYFAEFFGCILFKLSGFPHKLNSKNRFPKINGTRSSFGIFLIDALLAAVIVKKTDRETNA